MVCPTIIRRSLLLAGHVRPGPQASQTKIDPSPWILWAYPKKGCQRSFLPERILLEARVSGQDDDVRRFLRGGGFDLIESAALVEFRHRRLLDLAGSSNSAGGSLAAPRAVGWWPSWASILSEGPFRDLPPTMGQTAKPFSLLARRWARISGTARIGPMLISGLLGQMKMRSASRMASRTPRAGNADSTPAKLIPFTIGSARRFTKYS